MNEEQKLEELMHSFVVPPAKPDQVDKIVNASLQITQKQSLWNYIRRISAEFYLPAPAYSFALLVLIGFAFGFSSNSDDSTNNNQPNVFEQLLEDDGVL